MLIVCILLLLLVFVVLFASKKIHHNQDSTDSLKLCCIYSSNDEIEAGMLKGILDENDIPNFLQNYTNHSMFGLVVPGAYISSGTIKLVVNENDAEKALELISQFIEDGTQGQETFQDNETQDL